jgi:hypothetical protein
MMLFGLHACLPFVLRVDVISNCPAMLLNDAVCFACSVSFI